MPRRLYFCLRGGCTRKHSPFREKPLCRVQEVYVDDRNYPKVEAEDDDLLILFKLCKAGYASSVKEAAELDARTVLQAIHYEKFCTDYQDAFSELNK